MQTTRTLLLCAAVLVSGIVQAQTMDISESYSRRIKTAETMGALGPDLFGESTNFYNGQTTFSATDIDLPGNNALPVRLSRSRTAADSDDLVASGLAGGWEVDLPYVSGNFALEYGWQVSGSTPFNRCSSGFLPPTASAGVVHSRFDWYPSTFWAGNSLSVPGSGSQLLLGRYAGVPAPTDGVTNRFVTTQNWQIRCGVQIANPSSATGFSGEGFVALAPDGTQYTFAWMTSRQIRSLSRPAPPPPGPNPPLMNFERIDRVNVRIYVTRVEDRFGNSVNYSYTGNKLDSITASDGRKITLAYNTDGLLASATAHGRTWLYTYTNGFRVELPDHTAWQYSSFSSFRFIYSSLERDKPPCFRPGTWTTATAANRQLVVTHPSGAVGTFTFSPTRQSRSLVWNECVQGEGNLYGNKPSSLPTQTDNFALTQKQISGPGLTPAIWKMAYVSPDGSFGGQPGGIQGPTGPSDLKTVTVTNPDSSATRYTFGIRWFVNEGKMVRTEMLSPSGTLLRDEAITYALNPSNPPYSVIVGASGPDFPDDFAGTTLIPRTQTVVKQNGDTFTNDVTDFDVFAREVSVTRSNSLGMTRTDRMAYYDDTAHWVVGQVKSMTNVDTGRVMAAMDYDVATAQPVRMYKFGLLQATLGYNPDGTVATMENGLGATSRVSFDNWKRGAPQLITFPDLSTRKAVIDDYGLVSNVTDERNNKTSYTYDTLGRLAGITYPGSDSVTWAAKTISFAPLTTSELGIPVGAWRMRLNEANHQKSVYLDARYQPILEEERDTTTSEVRYLRRSFDWRGMTTFQSYPSASSSPTTGINSLYDDLGRMTTQRTTDNITLGQISYLSGNRRQMTDADNKVSTASYQAYDAPAYDAALQIAVPEGQTTTMGRDVFGMIQSVTQSGLYQGSDLRYTRTTTYDQFMRPCRRFDPEAGTTLWGYNAASQTTWEAKGQSSSTCLAAAPADATNFTYDLRGRKTLDDYPGTADDVSYGFDPAGNPISVTRGGAVWTYAYNKRGLLESEQAKMDGRTYTLDPTYNSLGQLKTRRYPDSLTVDYNPNAFGQPTQMNAGTTIGDLVRSIQYHPNGQINSYQFGNALSFTQTLDSRQRPWVQQLEGALGAIQRFAYTYSNAGDLKNFDDQINDVDDAVLTYDNLHRLKTAHGTWGDYSYSYDPLNNLRSRGIGATGGVGDLIYAYDAASNRLSGVTQQQTPTPPPPSPPAPPPPPPPPPGPPCPGVCPVDPVQPGPQPSAISRAVTSTAPVISRSYGYNTRGAITGDGVRTFTLNSADQISAIAGVATYSYDGNGKRIKTVQANGTIEYAIYDLSGALVYTDKLGSAHTVYLQLDGKTIAEVENGTPTYLHPDLLGSPRMATARDGQIPLWNEHFDPYGNKLNGVNEKIGYTGHAWDSETNLTYAQARFYDPVVGRFLSVDPIGFSEASSFTFNRYAYVNNNPYGGTDPTGMCSPSDRACAMGGDGGLDGIEGVRSSGSRLPPLSSSLGRMPVRGGAGGTNSNGFQNGDLKVNRVEFGQADDSKENQLVALKDSPLEKLKEIAKDKFKDKAKQEIRERLKQEARDLGMTEGQICQAEYCSRAGTLMSICLLRYCERAIIEGIPEKQVDSIGPEDDVYNKTK